MGGNGRKQETGGWCWCRGSCWPWGSICWRRRLSRCCGAGGAAGGGDLPCWRRECSWPPGRGPALCRRQPLGSLPRAMACAGGFLAVLIAVALLCWEEQPGWAGEGSCCCAAPAAVCWRACWGAAGAGRGDAGSAPAGGRKKPGRDFPQKYRSCRLVPPRRPVRAGRRRGRRRQMWGAAVFRLLDIVLFRRTEGACRVSFQQLT